MMNTFYLPLKKYAEDLWPQSIIPLPPLEQLEGIWMSPPVMRIEPSLQIGLNLSFERELALNIPGVNAMSVVIFTSPEPIQFELNTDPTPIMRLVDLPLALRFSPDLLRPARRSPGDPNQIEPDPTKKTVEVALGQTTLSLDFDGTIDLGVPGALNLPLCLVGATGIAVEASGVQFFGSINAPPPGQPQGWRGIAIGQAKLYLPGELGNALGQLQVSDCTIGNGGFSGTVSDTRAVPLQTQLIGMQFDLEAVFLRFVQNTLAESSIRGKIVLPFFNEPLSVEIGIHLDGSFSISLLGGLPVLSKPGLLDLKVERLGFVLQNGKAAVCLSGELTPRFGGLDWPGFTLEDLEIDSEGNVHLEGGWLDLRSQYHLNFYGFGIEITKLGFGKNSDGGQWIGFSGGIRLVDGLPMSTSVEGLRLTWHGNESPSISLNGLTVEMEVPGVYQFKGSVAYRTENNIHRFDGSVRLNISALGLEVDGVLVAGSAAGYNFFAIYIDVELPAGIPLGPTGLSLYGLAGLFAFQMEPGKQADEEWYSLDHARSWFHRGQPGANDLTKWTNREGSVALGAGITLGTAPDNGFSVSAKLLMVLIFPGPIIIFQGGANLLKERSSLSDDPLFRALAVLDGRAGNFTIGLDAHYQYLLDGELIDIYGGAEAFFSAVDLSAWHLYLGQNEPRERRITADIFWGLFSADAYFMLDAHRLAMGARVGYDQHFEFGPLEVILECWIEGNASLSIKPIHFHGDMWLHGRWALRVFGFGIGLSLDAKIAADVFRPFYLKASVSVGISLPWPLPDFDVDIALEWGDGAGDLPMPLPLKEIAVEHFKSTTTWPLRRGSLLMPNYNDPGNDGFMTAPTGGDFPPDPARVPVVPLDSRPHLTFTRPIHDDAGVGVGGTAPAPEYEPVGDPMRNDNKVKFRYALEAVTLEKRDGANWVAVAAAPSTGTMPHLYGSWAPVPSNTPGQAVQVKLWLWSKTPFEYARSTSRNRNELAAFAVMRYPKANYPCVPDPVERMLCCDFHHLIAGQAIYPGWEHPDCPGLYFFWQRRNTTAFFVCTLYSPIYIQALAIEGNSDVSALEIHLPPGVRSASVTLVSRMDLWLMLEGYDMLGNAHNILVPTQLPQEYRLETYTIDADEHLQKIDLTE